MLRMPSSQKDWVSARTIANISNKVVEVEKEDLNTVGDGLTPVISRVDQRAGSLAS